MATKHEWTGRRWDAAVVLAEAFLKPDFGDWIGCRLGGMEPDLRIKVYHQMPSRVVRLVINRQELRETKIICLPVSWGPPSESLIFLGIFL